MTSLDSLYDGSNPVSSPSLGDFMIKKMLPQFMNKDAQRIHPIFRKATAPEDTLNGIILPSQDPLDDSRRAHIIAVQRPGIRYDPSMPQF